MFGIKIRRLPRIIRGDKVTLRLYHLNDLPILHRCSRSVDTTPGLHAFGSSSGNLWSFKRWIGRTFQVLYLIIDHEASQASRIAGYIGLYDIRLGEQLTLSIGIFDPRHRGIGLGRKAMEILLEAVANCRAAQTIQVEIAHSHVQSLAFFKQLGFDIRQQSERALLMAKTVCKDQ
jgi:RimJ/RimL family protein N-acetyltransferase